MSTRYSKNSRDGFSIPLGFEGSNIPDAIELPSNTIEDVDKALFELFDKQIPFQYDRSGTMTRAPVIFASGERFATLRRRQPLRDKMGVLILPIISIMRTSITQTNSIGGGTSELQTQFIKKKLSEEDQYYQRLLNYRREKNSRDLAIDSNISFADDRLRTERQEISDVPQGMEPIKGNNIYEIIEIPPVKFFTATYEITFWAQYTLQMNDMIMALMSLYQNNTQRTFRLETSKGYWFVGYVGEQLSNGDNFDSFVDDERLIRYTFEIVVPSYVVGAKFPGSSKPLRRFLSAPEISFASWYEDPDRTRDASMGIPSGNPDDYVFDDLRTTDQSKPAQSIAIDRVSFRNSNDAANLGGYALDKLSNANSKGEITYRGVQIFVAKRSDQ